MPRRRPEWALPGALVTPESVYRNRRQILQALGGSLGVASIGGCGLSVEGDVSGELTDSGPYDSWFPVPPNAAFPPGAVLTAESDATTWNNFYEMTTTKDAVWQLVGNFVIEPWAVQIDGLCRNPGTWALDDLFRQFDMEERVYRHRCVERWAMVVPWSGFPLSKLIALADPLPEADHVAFISENRPDEMPGVNQRPNYPWPYFEGLRLDEAMNDLAFVATGLYGRGLPKQNGAPIRLVVPWKYGYKSIKSIVRITLVKGQPPTFWNTLSPQEYGFLSNVDPGVPHPRWSQEMEWLIPDSANQVPTQKYNGYEALVGHLYE